MNTTNIVQLSLGALLILGGAAAAVFVPAAGLGIAGLLIPSGIAVAGFSNTVVKAVGNTIQGK